jgi:hypothetical protein
MLASRRCVSRAAPLNSHSVAAPAFLFAQRRQGALPVARVYPREEALDAADRALGADRGEDLESVLREVQLGLGHLRPRRGSQELDEGAGLLHGDA